MPGIELEDAASAPVVPTAPKSGSDVQVSSAAAPKHVRAASVSSGKRKRGSSAADTLLMNVDELFTPGSLNRVHSVKDFGAPQWRKYAIGRGVSFFLVLLRAL